MIAYAYALERITAYTSDSKTSYIYDGRGSVAQAISAPVAGEAVSSALPDVGVQVQSFSYTAFGEQMGSVEVSGFAYNAEAYDAATGMLNLRARLYEPAMNRFSQKDIIRGQAVSPLSLNRYAYCVNSPVMHTDPSGESVLDSIGNWWNKAKQTTIGKVVDTLVVKPFVKKVKQVTNVITSTIKSVVKSAAETAAKEYNTDAFQLFSSLLKKMDGDGVYYSEKFKDVVDNMQNEIRSLDPSDVNYKKKTQEIVAKYCDYFNNYEEQQRKSSAAYDSLTAWIEGTQTNKAAWLGKGRDLLMEMNAEKEKYPPQIRALIEQAASEVIYNKKTTLTNAKFKNSDTDLLNKAESKYLDFYRKLQALLYPSGNQETEVPSKPETSEYKNLFGTEITSKTWRGYHGSAQEITEQNWKNYVSMLIDLNNQGRIDYGSAYPNNKEHYSSLVYYEDMLYIDCWGLMKTGAKVTLESGPLNELTLNGPVNSIYKALETKGEVQKTVINNETTYPDLKTGISIFIDNKKERIDSSGKRKFIGYDHVMTYIEDLDYKDADGQPIHLDHALVGIGAKGEGLQIYNFDAKYDEWISKGIEFRWGDQ